VTLVIDASLLVALASFEPAGAVVEERLAADEDLHAPALVYYEVASGRRKAIVGGRMRPEQLRTAVAPRGGGAADRASALRFGSGGDVAGQLERKSV